MGTAISSSAPGNEYPQHPGRLAGVRRAYASYVGRAGTFLLTASVEVPQRRATR